MKNHTVQNGRFFSGEHETDCCMHEVSSSLLHLSELLTTKNVMFMNIQNSIMKSYASYVAGEENRAIPSQRYRHVMFVVNFSP